MIYLCDLSSGELSNKHSMSREGIMFELKPCFGEWLWYKYEEMSPLSSTGSLFIGLDSIQHKLTKPVYNTITSFISWASEHDICTRLVFNKSTYTCKYALEFPYDLSSMYLDELYMKLCMLRLLTREFLPQGIPENMSCRQLFSYIFYDNKYALSYGYRHLPIEDGLFPNVFMYDESVGIYPRQSSELLGRALYDFWSQKLLSKDWSLAIRDVFRSNIKRQDWLLFYENWYNTSETKELDF